MIISSLQNLLTNMMDKPLTPPLLWQYSVVMLNIQEKAVVVSPVSISEYGVYYKNNEGFVWGVWTVMWCLVQLTLHKLTHDDLSVHQTLSTADCHGKLHFSQQSTYLKTLCVLYLLALCIHNTMSRHIC